MNDQNLMWRTSSSRHQPTGSSHRGHLAVLFLAETKPFQIEACLIKRHSPCAVQLMRTNRNTRPRLTLSIVMIGVLCVLLPALAFLQYRWIGQVSESERERLEEGLDIATGRFADDIFREFSGIASSFLFPPTSEDLGLEAHLSRSLERWKSTAPYPDIVRSVYVSEFDRGGELTLRQFNPEFGSLARTEWPTTMDGLKVRLDELKNFQFPDTSRTPANYSPTASPDPAPVPGENHSLWIMVPMVPQVRAAGLSARNIQRPLAGLTLIEIDIEVFASELLPAVVATHFEARDYKIAVFESAHSERIVFRSEEALSRNAMTSPDRAITLLAPDRRGRGLFAPAPPHRGRSRGIMSRRFTDLGLPSGRGEGGRNRGPQAIPFTIVGPSWQLVAQHQAGSLESAVSTLQRRNLSVGLGILAMLGVSGIMTIVWAERVRSIGRLQMEFAAGISHELRTPLTTIRTAAHKIASGVVSKPEEVREYAAMVKAEGRRLSQMVDQTIQFAQTESGRRHYELRRVAVPQVVERTLGVTFSSSDEAHRKVRIDLDPTLPLVLADETALTHSLGNLISNALKYGVSDDTVAIEARQDTRTNRVQLSVTNSGAELEPSDVQHIFEPFYRGRNIGGTSGSGLGLSLVRKMIEGQNGEVTVSSQPGQTRFTLHIPAIPPIEQPGALGAQS